jgi:hypothetical protein|tara:strand:+ start:189 stop:476 length:288 start_codon:yes stop_codon:yes gene_type:complete
MYRVVMDKFDFDDFMEMGEDIMYSAFDNSYLMLTGKITMLEFMNVTVDTDYTAVLAHDPDDPTRDQVSEIIRHFEEQEEYEKCAELKKISDSLKE